MGRRHSPGEAATFTVTASPGEKLSLATMFVPSNDGFYGPADGIALFQNGSPVSGNVTSQIGLYDAGTKQNQKLFGPATKPMRPHANYGPSESKPVRALRQVNDGNYYPANSSVIKVTVTAMPIGGAATGGGSTSGVEDLGLFAVGGAAVIAGGVAFAARKRLG